MISKYRFLQSLRRFFQKKPAPHFVINLQKKLMEEAPEHLNKPEKSFGIFSFLKGHKISFVTALVFILFFSGVGLTNFLFSHNTHVGGEDIINRAYAAYEEDQNQDGILYQKTLFEGVEDDTLIKNYIEEDWRDTKGNSLYLRRKVDDGTIFLGSMSKKVDGEILTYTPSPLPLFLESLKNNDPHIADNLNSGSANNSFSVLLRKSLHDNELIDIFIALQLELAINNTNITNTDTIFSFDVVNVINQNPEQLFTIQINKKTNTIKALKNNSPEELTDIDYKYLKNQIHSSLEKNPVLAEVIKRKMTLSGRYYRCFERVKDINGEALSILYISEQDPSVSFSNGTFTPKEEKIENSYQENALDKNYNDIVEGVLSTQKVKDILEILKNQKNVMYDETEENGLHYYVFTVTIGDGNSRYFFDTQTYRLAKEEITSVVNYSKPVIITHLETKHLSQDEFDTIFDPAQYDLYPEPSFSVWEPLPTMKNGCYDADDQPLTQEKETTLLQSVSPGERKLYDDLRRFAVKNVKEGLGDGDGQQLSSVNRESSVKNLAIDLIAPVKKGQITQDFHEGHYGIDIAPYDKNLLSVVAAADGTIIKIAESGYNAGYGKYMIIDHGHDIKTLYTHLEDVQAKEGDQVKQGQVIGTMGKSGKTIGETGIVLHFEVQVQGKKINPLPFMKSSWKNLDIDVPNE